MESSTPIICSEFSVLGSTSGGSPIFSLIFFKHSLLQSFGKDHSKAETAAVWVGKFRCSSPDGSHFPWPYPSPVAACPPPYWSYQFFIYLIGTRISFYWYIIITVCVAGSMNSQLFKKSQFPSFKKYKEKDVSSQDKTPETHFFKTNESWEFREPLLPIITMVCLYSSTDFFKKYKSPGGPGRETSHSWGSGTGKLQGKWLCGSPVAVPAAGKPYNPIPMEKAPLSQKYIADINNIFTI